jgi:equilibrative nucleoside transporter 1/2/3
VTAPVAPTPVQELVRPPPQKVDVMRITRHLWVWILAVFCNFVVTLAVFPAVAALVESTGRGSGTQWTDKYFNPVGCFLLYNVGDFIGRILAAHVQRPRNTAAGAWIVLVCSLMRVAFLPLFIFCNASPFNRHNTSVYSSYT